MKDFWGTAWFSGEEMEGSVFANGVSNMHKRKLAANELLMRGGTAGGGGAAGGRDHKNITEPCGKITKILSWHNQNHVNTPSAPLSPPSDIMTGPLARKPRSSNDTTPYMFIY